MKWFWIPLALNSALEALQMIIFLLWVKYLAIYHPGACYCTLRDFPRRLGSLSAIVQGGGLSHSYIFSCSHLNIFSALVGSISYREAWRWVELVLVIAWRCLKPGIQIYVDKSFKFLSKHQARCAVISYPEVAFPLFFLRLKSWIEMNSWPSVWFLIFKTILVVGFFSKIAIWALEIVYKGFHPIVFSHTTVDMWEPINGLEPVQDR